MPMINKLEQPLMETKMWGHTLQTKFVFINQIARKMKNGYSPIIGICGGQRIGKSFIAVWIAYIIYLLKGEKFDPTNITFYDPDKAMESLGNKHRDVVLVDEASDVMDYQEWYNKTHRMLRSAVNTQAYKTILYIFISPFIAQIDRSLRIHCDYLIHVTSRGRFRVWKYIKRYDSDEIRQTTYKMFLDSGSINLMNLPKNTWKKYLDFSKKEKEKIRISRHGEEQGTNILIKRMKSMKEEIKRFFGDSDG